VPSPLALAVPCGFAALLVLYAGWHAGVSVTPFVHGASGAGRAGAAAIAVTLTLLLVCAGWQLAGWPGLVAFALFAQLALVGYVARLHLTGSPGSVSLGLFAGSIGVLGLAVLIGSGRLVIRIRPRARTRLVAAALSILGVLLVAPPLAGRNRWVDPTVAGVAPTDLARCLLLAIVVAVVRGLTAAGPTTATDGAGSPLRVNRADLVAAGYAVLAPALLLCGSDLGASLVLAAGTFTALAVTRGWSVTVPAAAGYGVLALVSTLSPRFDDRRRAAGVVIDRDAAWSAVQRAGARLFGAGPDAPYLATRWVGRELGLAGVTEQFGWLGATVTLSLFAALLVWLATCARRATGTPAGTLAAGLTAMLAAAVVLPLVAVTTGFGFGVTMPFLGTDPTSFLVTAATVGYIAGTSARRPKRPPAPSAPSAHPPALAPAPASTTATATSAEVRARLAVGGQARGQAGRSVVPAAAGLRAYGASPQGPRPAAAPLTAALAAFAAFAVALVAVDLVVVQRQATTYTVAAADGTLLGLVSQRDGEVSTALPRLFRATAQAALDQDDGRIIRTSADRAVLAAANAVTAVPGGSAVAIEPRSGNVLAVAEAPGFDAAGRRRPAAGIRDLMVIAAAPVDNVLALPGPRPRTCGAESASAVNAIVHGCPGVSTDGLVGAGGLSLIRVACEFGFDGDFPTGWSVRTAGVDVDQPDTCDQPESARPPARAAGPSVTTTSAQAAALLAGIAAPDPGPGCPHLGASVGTCKRPPLNARSAALLRSAMARPGGALGLALPFDGTVQWAVGFAPVLDPCIAVAVVIDSTAATGTAGTGGSLAASSSARAGAPRERAEALATNILRAGRC
jgi:cell division protein FtsW (lipid II flippase)